jgi:hypothetical protein
MQNGFTLNIDWDAIWNQESNFVREEPTSFARIKGFQIFIHKPFERRANGQT